jgi:hypothetical protein
LQYHNPAVEDFFQLRFTGSPLLLNSLQTVLIGRVAAGVVRMLPIPASQKPQTTPAMGFPLLV